MLSDKELKFKIENNHLIVGNKKIDLNIVNYIEVRESSAIDGEYEIYISTINAGLELNLAGGCADVYDIFRELCEAVQENNPEFCSYYLTDLINRSNVLNVSHIGGTLLHSKVNIEFKQGKDLTHKLSKFQFKHIKDDIDRYNVDKSQQISM